MNEQLHTLCNGAIQLGYREAISDILKVLPEQDTVSTVDLLINVMELSKKADSITYQEVKDRVSADELAG